jgi:hypothetical protein|tara:strand:+ start:125 stop:433 length:309 start_codon:yes stop_codon:yes gene_type:complete
MKLNRANRNALISIFTLITVIFLLGYFKNTSKYQPKPIVIKTINDKSIFNLEDRIECVPGHTSEGSPYTKSLTPGGLCGAQKLVSEQAGGYEIEDGIGGSLI